MMKKKNSSTTSKHLEKMKNRIEALSSPGRPEDYRIQRIHKDKGSDDVLIML